MLSQKKITKLIEQNRDLLGALEEFDRTGQLRKLTAKERVNFTIDMELMRRFRSYCKAHGLKMSTVIEQLLIHKLGRR